MATITQRGPGQWQAKIRRKGHKHLSETFTTHAQAKEWADITEGRISGREYVDRTKEQRGSLMELLTRYLEEVTPSKKGARQETNRIKQWKAEPMANWSLLAVDSTAIADWRRRKVDEGKAPSTISNAMNLLSAVFKIAINEWGYKLTNPCAGVSRPKARDGRKPRLLPVDEAKLLAACKAGPPYLLWAARLALETGMRQGEIRRLRWEHIHTYFIHLPTTKNSTVRDVPLTEEAAAVIEEMRTALPQRRDGWVFGDPNVSAAEGGFTESMIQQAFRDAVFTAGIPHITFHDLRHISITTRLKAVHRDALELSKTTGHKSIQLLARYYNPDPEERAKEIRSRRKTLTAGA